METNNPKEMTFYIHSGIIVKPLFYDKLSGEVTYIMDNVSTHMTCLIAELGCVNGFTPMMDFLNRLPEKKFEPVKSAV